MIAARLILAIDTCGAAGSLALARIEENIAAVVVEADIVGKTYASFLVSRISDLLSEGGAKLDDLAAIAVVHGPGSFTGVRIGVAAAKALAEASGKPLLALSRLAVLCRQAMLEELCCGLLDAGRGEFYAGIYRGTECVREQLMTREEVENIATEATLVAAEPAVRGAFPHTRLISVRMPSVTDALPLAAARLLQNCYDDAATLDGNYLRRTDAELFAKPQSRDAGAGAMTLPVVTISDLCPEDVNELFQLERQTPSAPHWQRSDYEALFEADDTLSRPGVVARVGGLVAGFAIAKVLSVSGHIEAELETVVVRTGLQRSGIGGELMGALGARLARQGVVVLRLEVRASNMAAIALYKALGFNQTGLRKRYYRNPEEDAALMELHFPSVPKTSSH